MSMETSAASVFYSIQVTNINLIKTHSRRSSVILWTYLQVASCKLLVDEGIDEPFGLLENTNE